MLKSVNPECGEEMEELSEKKSYQKNSKEGKSERKEKKKGPGSRRQPKAPSAQGLALKKGGGRRDIKKTTAAAKQKD